ncbi:MAG: alpha/beta hydrolase-fold protein [Chitinophagaceae bacterium]|nr:alpha/beta hydrolase-fold protein [Chitinophagaceae bacterium]
MKRIFFLSLSLIATSVLFAQSLDQYESYRFIQNGDTLPYRILLPENYNPSTEYPLIIFLHGRGESGNDNVKQLTHGARMFLTDSIRKKHPAIVVFPQCGFKDYWSNVHTVADKNGKREFYHVPDGPPSTSMSLLMGLMENLFVQFKIKKDRVYAMGLSMGGMGVFELVRRKPGLVAAAIPICGGAHPATAERMRDVKWWVFHGADDDVVKPEFSVRMVEALKKVNASVQFTLYPGVKHNSWDLAFAEPGLMDWLFAQHK